MSFWAKIARFTGLRDGLVPASGGGSANVLFADGVWRSPGASSAQASPQFITAGSTFVVPANQQCVCVMQTQCDGTLQIDGTLVLTR